MTNSYYRKCKHCGRRIQMRRMPAGQFVAFEGYDQVHDCSMVPSKTYHEKKESREGDFFGDVGFTNFQLKEKNQTRDSAPAEAVGSGSGGFKDLDFKDFQVREKGRVGRGQTASLPPGRSGAARTVPLSQGQPLTSQTARPPQKEYSASTEPSIPKDRAYPSRSYRPKKSIWGRWGWLIIWALVLFGPYFCGKILHH